MYQPLIYQWLSSIPLCWGNKRVTLWSASRSALFDVGNLPTSLDAARDHARSKREKERERERKREKAKSLFLFMFQPDGSGTYPPHPCQRGGGWHQSRLPVFNGTRNEFWGVVGCSGALGGQGNSLAGFSVALPITAGSFCA
jgi:hypothetical protein